MIFVHRHLEFYTWCPTFCIFIFHLFTLNFAVGLKSPYSIPTSICTNMYISTCMHANMWSCYSKLRSHTVDHGLHLITLLWTKILLFIFLSCEWMINLSHHVVIKVASKCYICNIQEETYDRCCLFRWWICSSCCSRDCCYTVGPWGKYSCGHNWRCTLGDPQHTWLMFTIKSLLKQIQRMIFGSFYFVANNKTFIHWGVRISSIIVEGFKTTAICLEHIKSVNVLVIQAFCTRYGLYLL